MLGLRFAGTLAVGLLVAGCGGGGASLGGLFGDDRSAGSTSTASGSTGSTLRNLLIFNTTTAPEDKPVVEEREITCPAIEVLDGTSAMRVGQAGGGASAVAHQASMGQTARECRVNGNQLELKVGVEGRLLIGPLGKPGGYTVPLRVVVRRGTTTAVVSRFVRIPVRVPDGEAQAGFTHVEENIVVPLSELDPGDEYTILVGFDPAGASADRPRRRGG